MCESSVMINRNGQTEVVMDNVASITPEADGLLLVDLFGERKLVKGRISEIRLMEHKILLSED